MPSAGQNFNQTVFVSERPELVSQALISGTSGVAGYTVSTAGVGSIVLTRRYIPVWAIVVAVIGTLLFLLGLLALLYRETETMTVTLVPVEGGTQVTLSGTGSQELLTRLTATLNSMPALATSAAPRLASSASVSAAPLTGPPEKMCPECAESVKAPAKVCRFCGHKFEITTPAEGG